MARLRWWLKVLLRREPLVLRDRVLSVERYGSAYGGWWIHPAAIGPDSIVYSLGIGEDISFDLALIESFGVTVHGFDPTPRVAEWLRRQRLPDRFRFHPWGVAAHDGTLGLYPPENPSHVSHTVVSGAGAYGNAPLRVPARRLSTIQKSLGHERIDLLKMDIEGAEYEVLDDLIQENIPISQLLVEFHHRFPNIGIERTSEAVARLRRYGFAVFHVSAGGEISLLHESVKLDPSRVKIS